MLWRHDTEYNRSGINFTELLLFKKKTYIFSYVSIMSKGKQLGKHPGNVFVYTCLQSRKGVFFTFKTGPEYWRYTTKLAESGVWWAVWKLCLHCMETNFMFQCLASSGQFLIPSLPLADENALPHRPPAPPCGSEGDYYLLILLMAGMILLWE